jgi:hypothetical protein
MPTLENSRFETPILFIIFNRPEVTQKVFDQIKQVKPRYLYVAADGPRQSQVNDIGNCAATRKIIEQIDWHCDLKTLFREENLGCGPGVSSAITWFFENVEAGIILEDDCLPNLSFFPYCEALLIKYRSEDVVKFIGGNNFQNGIKRGHASYYFSHYPTSWGWATWRRSWTLFNADISDSTLKIKQGHLDLVFNSSMEKNHWLKSLHKANNERKSVWDFQFYYAIWLSKGLCVTPNQNLVVNLGFFDQGTHYFLKDSTKTSVRSESIDFPLVHPYAMNVDRKADSYTFNNFYSHSLSRSLRLWKENDLLSIFYYFKARFYKAS